MKIDLAFASKYEVTQCRISIKGVVKILYQLYGEYIGVVSNQAKTPLALLGS